MNAAFLLVTSAWLAGQAPPPPARPAPPPPPPTAVASSACCDTGCDSGCGGHGLFARLRELFHRHDCCEDTCHPAPPPPPPPVKHDCCDDCGCRPRLLDRLRALFHHDDCCDTCGTAGPHGAGAPGPAPEPIRAPKSAEPPKEMPKGSTSGAGVLRPQPALAPTTTLIIDR